MMAGRRLQTTSQSHAAMLLALSRCAMFAELTADQRAICAEAFTAQHFEAGQRLFGRGEVGSRFYVLSGGRVRLSLVSEEGRELSVRIAGPGEIVGEMAVIDGGLRSADAFAIERVETLSLAKPDFDRLLLAVPALAFTVIRHLCQRIRETTDQLEGIALHSIEQRLARFLLAQIGAYGGQGDGVARALTLSQTELGQLIGASRPKVSGAVAALEREGAIRRLPVIDFDLDILKRIAGFPDE